MDLKSQFKSPRTNNWWFRYNDKEVGYWPGDIFQLMKYQATLVQWGGEVYSPKHPETLYVSSDEWDCYDAYLLDRRVPKPVFLCGGPGGRRNPRC
ncbi:hypothetical protein R6Q57_029595 [Mikania cordata]